MKKEEREIDDHRNYIFHQFSCQFVEQSEETIRIYFHNKQLEYLPAWFSLSFV